MYGRAAFERVSQGASEIMLVAGFSGIGKTAVVNEVRKPIVSDRGYFIKGKYDQYQRNIPFSAFVQAFRDLMGQLLGESDAQIKIWKERILNAIGESGQVIIEVIPELKLIVGQQPSVPDLSGTAAQNRFNLLFQKFLKVFTSPEHPLVIFLDDLQWADSASLRLIKVLMSDANTNYLLIVGAYRDNEVSPAHPLILTLDEIQRTNARFNSITLSTLQLADLNLLVADTLKCSTQIALPLTQLIYQKTKGNPFFSNQFLLALKSSELIYFNEDDNYWQCDLSKVKTLALTEDVVEFMANQLMKMPATTKNVLQLAACIGNEFDLATLAIVNEKSSAETTTHLWKALQEGLVIPVTEIYKFFHGEKTQIEVKLTAVEMKDLQLVKYRFLHDRVQQAAYSLIPDDQKKSKHLKIGKLLLDNTTIAEKTDKIFTIISHLNAGKDLITQTSDRKELAQLNLIAAKKARKSTAYVAAMEYAKIGIDLLAGDLWSDRYDLALELHVLVTETAYLSGDFDTMQASAEIVLKNAKSLLETIPVCEVQILAKVAQKKRLEAIAIGLETLKMLNVAFPTSPTVEDIQQAFADTAALIPAGGIEELIYLPRMTNTKAIAALQMLITIIPPVYAAAPQLFPLTALAQVQLSINHGNAPLSAYAYAVYGLLLCGVVGDIESAYKLGNLALILLEKFNSRVLNAKVFFLVAVFIMSWKSHLRDNLSLLISGAENGLDTGDLEYAAWAYWQECQFSYQVGCSLDTLAQKLLSRCNAIKHLRQEIQLNYVEMLYQFVLNLQGYSDEPWYLNGSAYNQQQWRSQYEEANNFEGLYHLYSKELHLCYLFEKHSRAFDLIANATQYLPGVVGQPGLLIFYLYAPLTRLAIYPTLAAAEQQQVLEQVATELEKLKHWADRAPTNITHKIDLIEAERHRVLDRVVEAMDSYDRAIANARSHQYLHEEALANELAAKFYLERGKVKIAQLYMTEAYYCYVRWGAKAKIDDLQRCYPQLLTPILQQSDRGEKLSDKIFQSICNVDSSTTTITSVFDYAGIMKVSQAISGILQLDELLSALMGIIIENAGASKCVLILLKDDNLVIEATASRVQTSQSIEKFVLHAQPLSTSNDVPHSVVNYVKRTLKTLVIHDDQTAKALDTYLVEHQPQSLLCMPIMYQGRLIGILYLENKLTRDVFTSDRIAILSVIVSQAAISIENTRLFEAVQQAQLKLVQSDKMSALGNLVAAVAHEINNSVGFIGGNIQPALDYVQDILSLLNLYQETFPKPGAKIESAIEEINLDYVREDLPKLLDSMREGTQRIRSISNSLRTFSRADTENKVAFNIHDGIDSTVTILKHCLKANKNRPKIEVVLNYGKLPQVKCFPGQLNQVFMNLLTNAIDALEESNNGRSFESIKANPNCITVTTGLSKDLQQVLISIKDNGKGMSQEVQQRIFDHLFTTKAVGKGTGLGLAIARQIIVEKHGGTISVNSAPGEGAEFLISIPLY